MDAIDEFIRLQKNHQKQAVKPQLVMATVKSVDWANRKMVATGLVDNLEYYDVLLGLGHVDKKPKIGSKCLLGIIGNHEAFTFLVHAEKVEEMVVVSGPTELTINEDGYKIKKGTDTLAQILDDFMVEVMKIIVVNGTSINVPAVTAIKNRLNTVLK